MDEPVEPTRSVFQRRRSGAKQVSKCGNSGDAEPRTPPYQKLTRRNGVAARYRPLHRAEDKDGPYKVVGGRWLCRPAISVWENAHCTTVCDSCSMYKYSVGRCESFKCRVLFVPLVRRRVTGKPPRRMTAIVRANGRGTCPKFCIVVVVYCLRAVTSCRAGPKEDTCN